MSPKNNNLIHPNDGTTVMLFLIAVALVTFVFLAFRINLGSVFLAAW